LDGYDVNFDQKEYKSVVTMKPKKKNSREKPVGSEEKGKGKGKEKETQVDEVEELSEPFAVVLRPLSTVVVRWTMGTQRPIDIRGVLLPQLPTKNTFDLGVIKKKEDEEEEGGK
jgi:hypothetical protein